MEKNEEFFMCECNSEVLVTQKYDDDDFIYVAIHSHGYRKMNLWERIKYAFNYIKTGRAYEDEIVLSNDNANDLGEWLIKNTKK